MGGRVRSAAWPADAMMQLVLRIQSLLEAHARMHRKARPASPVGPLEHALQCAHEAERANAGDALVTAALLHDIGHFVEPAGRLSGDIDDLHEMRAVPFLAPAFGPAVTEPIRLHVQAKRYLVALDAEHAGRLPVAALRSLRLQGGAMGVDECRVFERLPYALDAVALRRWDDRAHQPGRRTPPLAHYLPLLDRLAVATALAAAA